MTKTMERKNMTQSIDGKVTREAKEDGGALGKYYWWKRAVLDDSKETKAEDAALAQEIASTIQFIANHQHGRIEQLTIATRLYGNSNAYCQLGASFGRGSVSSTSTPSANRISFNLCASVVDTLTAQIARQKVVPTFITSGGVWGMQRKAENLSKFIEGLFYEQNAHEKLTYQFRDGSVWGDGILHVYRNDKDRPELERVPPHEILVDTVESVVVNKTRQLHRIKICDRGVLAEMFPEHEETIMSASPANYKDLGADGSAADLIAVSESWHLRSGEKAKDGLRVMTLLDNSTILLKELYEKDYFPFVILPYSKRILGFWGQGACERLQNLQGEINRLMITIQKCMWLGSGFKILSHISDKVPVQHFNNEIAPIIKWSGSIAPQYISPQFVQPEISPYIDSLIAKGYQQEGVSQLAASNLKPQGVNSGAALRTFDSIAEDRQLFTAQRVENAALEVARQMIEVVRDVFKEKKQFKVNYPNTNFVESIDWKDIDLQRDEYWLKAFPTSSLPEEPAAKLETVQEYMQAGLISPRAGRRLLAMPDVEMSDKIANAAEELICKSIEDILYDGDEIIPEGTWDLVLAKSLYLQYMNYAQLNNCPENRLQDLREFGSRIDDLSGASQPPPPPQPGGSAMGAPQAMPAPQPVSNMIQNVPGAAA